MRAFYGPNVLTPIAQPGKLDEYTQNAIRRTLFSDDVIFWTEAPAKLVGWFDRVWSCGFAYGDKTMKMLDKAVFINTDGEMRFGTCDSRPETVDGKLRFYESWKWTEGEEGTSVIEEI